MGKAEWALLRDLQRGLGYVSKVCVKMEKEIETARTDREAMREEVSSVRSKISDMESVVEEMKVFLERKKKTRRVLFWLITVVLSAAMTTYTNYRVDSYLKHNAPAYIREEGDNGDMG